MAWTKEQAESLMLREHWQEIYARFERLVREKTCKHPRSIQAIVLPPPHYRRKLLHNVLLKESMQEAIRRQAENAYLQQTAQINLQQAMANQQASLQGDLLGQAVTIQEGLAGQRINAVDALKGTPLPDYRIYDELAKRMTQEQNRMKPPPKRRDLFPEIVAQRTIPGLCSVQVMKIPSAIYNGETYEIYVQAHAPEQKKPGWFSRWMDRPKPFLRPKFRVWPVIWVSAGLIGAGCVVLKSIFIIQENLTWTL